MTTIVGRKKLCGTCGEMKRVTAFRWFRERHCYSARCRECDHAASADYAAMRKTAAIAERAAPTESRMQRVRNNAAAPELVRQIRRPVEADRPKCPTCGQVAPVGEKSFLLKWCHRDLLGEPCPGWHPREMKQGRGEPEPDPEPDQDDDDQEEAD